MNTLKCILSIFFISMFLFVKGQGNNAPGNSGYVNPYTNGCENIPLSSDPFIELNDNFFQYYLGNNCHFFQQNVRISQGSTTNLETVEDRRISTQGDKILLKPGTKITPTTTGSANLIVADKSCVGSNQGGYVSGTPSANNDPIKPGWNLVFHDDFNGNQLDLSKWEYNIGITEERPASYYTETNDLGESLGREYATYHTGGSGSNISVQNGQLQIQTKNEVTPSSWVYEGISQQYDFLSTGGLINTKEEFLYGYFEARMKVPAGLLHWPAFWLFGGPGWQEIDILENVGGHNGSYSVGTNIHFFGDQSVDVNNDSYQLHYEEPVVDYPQDIAVSLNITQNWVTVGCLFEEGKISIFINNQLAREFTCIGDAVRIGEHADFSNKMNILLGMGLAPGNNSGFQDMIIDNTMEEPFIIDYVRYYQRDLNTNSTVENYDLVIPADIDRNLGGDIDEIVIIDRDGQNGGIRTFSVDNDQDINIFTASLYPEITSYLSKSSKMRSVSYTDNQDELLMINDFTKGEAIRIFDLSQGETMKTFINDGRFTNFLDFDDKYFVANYDGDPNNIDELIMMNTSQHANENFIRVIDLVSGEVLKTINYGNPSNLNSIGIFGWVDGTDKIFLEDLNFDGKFEEFVFVNTEPSQNTPETIRIYNINSSSYVFTDLLNSNLLNWVEPDDVIMIGDIDNADSFKELVVVKKDPLSSDIIKAIDLTNGNLKFNVQNQNRFNGFLDYCDHIELMNLNGNQNEELVFFNSSGTPQSSQGKAFQIYGFDSPSVNADYSFTLFSNNEYGPFSNAANIWPFNGDRIIKFDGISGTVVNRKSLLFVNTSINIDTLYNNYGLGNLKYNGFDLGMSLISTGVPSVQNPALFNHQYTGWLDGNDPNVTICAGFNSLYNKSGTSSVDVVAPLIDEKVSFTIYPNPFNEDFTINLISERELEDLRIEIVDPMGRLITSINNISSKTFNISLENQSKGVYFVILYSNSGKKVKRVIYD